MRTQPDAAIADDAYPTRGSAGESWTTRKDPVVWGEWSSQSPLSRSQTQNFAKNGYLVLHDVFNSREIEALQKASTQLRAEGDVLRHDTVIEEPGSRAVRTIFELEQQSATFARLAKDARIADPVRFLLDDDIYIHQSRLNYKPGFTGAPFYWHSDFETWHAEDGMPRMRAISASILLTDNDALNGPLMLMPGTHKRFLSCAGQTPKNNHRTSLKKQDIGVPSKSALSELAADYGIDYASGKAGTVILFDCNTIHGSNGNITPHPRSNAFFVYNAVSNAVQQPFSAPQRRPRYLSHQGPVKPLAVQSGPFA